MHTVYVRQFRFQNFETVVALFVAALVVLRLEARHGKDEDFGKGVES